MNLCEIWGSCSSAAEDSGSLRVWRCVVDVWKAHAAFIIKDQAVQQDQEVCPVTQCHIPEERNH